MKKKLFLLVLFSIITNFLIFTSCANEQIITAKNWEKKQYEEETELILKDIIPWNEAKYHIGEVLTVYGPVVSTYYYKKGKGRPTFLNIGNPYPNPDRFTVVIWGSNRDNFPQAPEVYYNNKTIYVYGLIEEYKGLPEIIVDSPNQIKE